VEPRDWRRKTSGAGSEAGEARQATEEDRAKTGNPSIEVTMY
jgi:hypothetical protein